MASAQDFIQNSQTRTVQHNHVIIQYQQPPGPNNSEPCFRNIGSLLQEVMLKRM